MAAIVADIATAQEYKQDGPEAHEIAAVIPYYPFHGVPRFYDISGMTHNPEVFQLCIDVFVRRYRELGVDCIAGLDARGFVLGPPIALALKKPFIMIRKVGKLPNAVTGSQYYKEYQGANAAGGDELCISRTAITPGARVLVIGEPVTTHIITPLPSSYYRENLSSSYIMALEIVTEIFWHFSDDSTEHNCLILIIFSFSLHSS